MATTRYSADSTSPSTPPSNLRARNTGAIEPGNNVSPTSTYSDSSENGFRINDGARSSLQSVFSTPFVTPARRPLVRSDPALLTCFDPSDKELYDLWAPQR